MSGSPVPDVAALVLAARGGVRLARALDSVAWAGQRVVVDPADRIDPASLPRDVVRVARLADVPAGTRTPWLLLLLEEEAATLAFAGAVQEAVAAGRPEVYRVASEVRGFGASVVPAGASVRLVRRGSAAIELRAGLVPGLRVRGGRPGQLRVPLVADVGDSLATAVEDLEADAATLAAVLRSTERAPRVRAAAFAALAGTVRVVFGRRAAPARPSPWARWALAAFAGYRSMVAYGKLWERLQMEAAALQ